MLGGLGRFRGRAVMVLGTEKGSDTDSRVKHNFGMARPEGYRKARRLIELAGRFGLPVLSFVDTSGAFPGIDAEARGQAEAIARSIEACLEAPVPLVATIIGEGGSGGAMALAAGDRVLMLEHAIYSVISPEGCASILLRDAAQAPAAAEALRLTAEDLKRLALVDVVIPEPLGGAQRDAAATIAAVGDAVADGAAAAGRPGWRHAEGAAAREVPGGRPRGAGVAWARALVELLGSAVGIGAAFALWLGLARMLPVDLAAERLGLAFASLLPAVCVLNLMVVTQMALRARSGAVDPLAGRDGALLQVNQRALTNTVEQLAGFAPALLALAAGARRSRCGMSWRRAWCSHWRGWCSGRAICSGQCCGRRAWRRPSRSTSPRWSPRSGCGGRRTRRVSSGRLR